MDLFRTSFPTAKWPEILALNSSTAKGRTFHALRPGLWVRGEDLARVAGFDYRTRCSRLRDLGVPVESRSVTDSPCYQFRISSTFLMAYEEMRNQRRSA